MANIAADSIGFIGLGAMGMWMAVHLAEKLPESTKLQVYDIVPALVEELYSQYPNKIIKASSPKGVADKSVRRGNLSCQITSEAELKV
jgi:3-hydroxyisobutyrate dehydrogenase